MGMNKKIFVITCLFLTYVIIFSSCKNQTEKEKIDLAKKNDSIGIKDESDDIAKFIAGIPTRKFAKIQDLPFYRSHAEWVEKTWTNTIKVRLDPIKTWVEAEKITTPADSCTLFYPFSGPDFLYASTFFPHCKSYLMFGLENPGNLPKIDEIPEKMLSGYLDSIRGALRFMNKYGFFVTSYMRHDFAAKNLNGLVHIMFFFMARNDCKITSFTPFEINKFGNMVPKATFEYVDKQINGVKIEFTMKNQMKRTLYYIPIDVSDENLKEHLEFITFLSGFGEKITYIKSASYLLFNKNFSFLRNVILTQSKKILQDDSGIKFSELKEHFSVKLYGTYTNTIRQFPKQIQPDLINEVANRAEKLPFLIGYNVFWKQTVLMLATPLNGNANNLEIKQTENKVVSTEKVVYKLQIKSSAKKIDTNADIFKNLPFIDFYFADGLYKYTIGQEKSEDACEKLKTLAESKGFKGAFVVAFYKNNRISLEEAKKIN